MTNIDAQRIKEIRDNTKTMAEAFSRIADTLADALELFVADRKTEPQNGYQTFNGTSVYVSRLEDEPQDIEKIVWHKDYGWIEDGQFREPTEEERKAVSEYIKSISKPTGVNIFDIMDDVEDEPQTETKTETKNSNVILVNDGVTEAVRCAMCNNPNKSDRGCDGACSYDEVLYKKIIDAIHECVYEPKTEPQTVKCPKCGRTDYIKFFGKNFGIAQSIYDCKCINCNTYFNVDEPQTERSE